MKKQYIAPETEIIVAQFNGSPLCHSDDWADAKGLSDNDNDDDLDDDEEDFEWKDSWNVWD